MSINKAILIGRLGADPELKQSTNGDNFANLSVATSEYWTDKRTGNRQEHTEWHKVVLYGRLADVAAQYLTKGKEVYIEGALRSSQWTDNHGQKRFSVFIKASNLYLLGGKSPSYDNPKPKTFATPAIADDDCPF